MGIAVGRDVDRGIGCASKGEGKGQRHVLGGIITGDALVGGACQPGAALVIRFAIAAGRGAGARRVGRRGRQGGIGCRGRERGIGSSRRHGGVGSRGRDRSIGCCRRNGGIGRRRRSTAAGREFKRTDARLPVIADRLVVFGGEPEGAVIYRIDAHRGIIAPAVVTTRLRAGAGDQGCFSLAQRAQRIRSQAPGIANCRIHGRTGNAVAHRHIALAVHCQAAHPAVIRIGLVSALLVDAGGAIRVADFVPADAGHTASSHRVGGPQRFGAAAVAILDLHHQAVAQCVHLLCTAQLRYLNRRLREAGDADIGRSGEG